MNENAGVNMVEKQFLSINDAKKAIDDLVENENSREIIWKICSRKKLMPFRKSPNLQKEILEEASGKVFRLDLKKLNNYEKFVVFVAKEVDVYNTENKKKDKEELKEPEHVKVRPEKAASEKKLDDGRKTIGVKDGAKEYDSEEHKHWQD